MASAGDYKDRNSRWSSTGSPGARHVNDIAPFSLYDVCQGRFTGPNRKQFEWILETYSVTKVSCSIPYLTCFTSTPPPVPVPLTIGGMPAIFSPLWEVSIPFLGETTSPSLTWPTGDTTYANPRVEDPCPSLTWPTGTFPSRYQMISTIEALKPIASIRKVYFLRTGLIVELEHQDARVYLPGSLPGIIARKGVTYYHGSTWLFSQMEAHMGEKEIDRARFSTGTVTSHIVPENTNYLPRTNLITPGVMVSSGPVSSNEEPLIILTTCGVQVRKGSQMRVTVANHGFLSTNNVFHSTSTGSKLGDIAERYPDLDVALVDVCAIRTGEI